MYYQFIITLNFFIKNQTLQKNTLSKIETLKKKPYKKISVGFLSVSQVLNITINKLYLIQADSVDMQRKMHAFCEIFTVCGLFVFLCPHTA